MTLLPLLLALLLPARADQSRFEVGKAPRRWTFDVAWADAAGQRHEASYTLPAAKVTADLEEPLRFPAREAAEAVVAEVRAAGKGMGGVTVKASVGKDDAVRINASGRSAGAVRDALAELEQVRDQAMDRYLDAHGYTRIRGGISPDHARHVAEYAEDLAPVVRALGGPGEDPRAFAATALAFVQSIPYERRARIGDRYRRPLSVLGRNKGDCDSKTVLYLALVHQAWPELPLGVVYVEGHALAALGIDKERGDKKIRAEGQRFVLAEPVGPALSELGEISDATRSGKRKWKEVRLVQ